MQQTENGCFIIHREQRRHRDGLPNIEEMRISRSEHRGKPNLHIRVWFRTATGEYRPTRRGITIPLSAAPHILAAVAALVPDAVEAWLAGELEDVEMPTGNESEL